MKVTIGIPMHNAPYSVVHAVRHAIQACKKIDADYWILVMDDWSHGDDINLVKNQLQNEPNVSIVKVSEQFPDTKTNPNLGLVLNSCLDQVSVDTDYYLNLESDVYLEPQTLKDLIRGLDENPDAPVACPIQFNSDLTHADFIFWGMGMILNEQIPGALRIPQRPKWCNLGCLLIRGEVARDRRCRVDADAFRLWCVDQDFTCTVAQFYGRPLYWPDAQAVHLGRQSTLEGKPEGYGHLVSEAVRRADTKWAEYLAGGLLF